MNAQLKELLYKKGFKICGNNKCQLAKPLSEFSKQTGALDGLRGYCKACGALATKASLEKRAKKLGITTAELKANISKASNEKRAKKLGITTTELSIGRSKASNEKKAAALGVTLSELSVGRSKASVEKKAVALGVTITELNTNRARASRENIAKEQGISTTELNSSRTKASNENTAKKLGVTTTELNSSRCKASKEKRAKELGVTVTELNVGRCKATLAKYPEKYGPGTRYKTKQIMASVVRRHPFRDGTDDYAEMLIGLTPELFKLYIGKFFTPEMTWSNHGTYWHIDHIIPCKAAQNEAELEALQWFTNLRPMEAKANISKGGTHDADEAHAYFVERGVR